MEENRPGKTGRYYTAVAAALMFLPAVAFSVAAPESFRAPKLWAGEGIAFLGALGGWWVGRRGDKKADYGDLVWGLTAIAAAFSLINTTHLLTGLQELTRLAALVLAFSLFRRAPDPWRVCPAILLAASVNGAIALAQAAGWRPVWWVPWEGRHAVYGTFGNPNFIAEYLAPIVVLAIGWSLETGKRTRWAYGTAVAILSLAVLFLTVSRSAWLGLAVGASVFLVAGFPALRAGGRGGLLGLAAAAFIIVSVTMWSPLWTRVASSFGGDEPGVATRLFMWKTAVRQFREHPVIGCGPGGYGLGYLDTAAGMTETGTMPPPYPGITSDAHNDGLQLLAERGMVGGLLWIAAFVFLLIPAFRGLPGSSDADRLRKASALGAMATVLVSSMFGFPMRIFPTAAVFLFALACLAPLADPGPDWLSRAVRIRTLVVGALGLVMLGLTVSAEMALARGRDQLGGEAALRTGLMILPWHGELHFRLGRVLLAADRLDSAAVQFNAALPGFRDPDVYFSLGVVAFRQKRYADAAGFFQEGLRRYPRHKPAAWADLAETLLASGLEEEAATAARRALEIDPAQSKAAMILKKIEKEGRHR